MNPHEKGCNTLTEIEDTKEANKMDSKSAKRVHDDNGYENKEASSSEPAKKLPKLDQSPVDTQETPEKTTESEISSSLLNLSDDVLLQIFGYLDSATLTKLTLTCRRLRNICSDATLWVKFDTEGVPLTVKELRSMLKFVNKRTTSITVHGFLKIRSKMHHESLTKATLESISQKCPDLLELKLKDCFIDAQNGMFKVNNFLYHIRNLLIN